MGRQRSRADHAATILLPPGAAIPTQLEKNKDVHISKGTLGGAVIVRVVIHFAQANFGPGGAVFLRISGSREFRPCLNPGVALAIGNGKNEVTRNHHFCPNCCRNRGKKGRFIRAEGDYAVFLFSCSCGVHWEAKLPNFPNHRPDRSRRKECPRGQIPHSKQFRQLQAKGKKTSS